MNAKELADGLEDAIEDPWNAEEWVRVRVKEAATMLRQQQAEIERLQRLCESYIRSDYEGTSMFQPFMEELYGKAQEK